MARWSTVDALGVHAAIGVVTSAGRAVWTNGTVPAGQVGVWCSDSSDNEFDNFWVRDIAGPYECDGRYFSNKGSVRVDYNDSNLLEVTGSDWRDFTIVRRGFRGSEYVATFKFKWNNSTSPGWLVRWLDPGNFLAVVILQTDSKARLYQCEGDSGLSTLATSGTALNLTTDNWYEGKVVIDTDAGSQRLRFWVDTDSDGDYSDETTLLSTNTVDDDWDAGHVGLYRREPGSDTQQFDDVKIGIDNNSDGDILDAGDDVQIDDDFGSNAMSLTYDNNGNLTDDGVYKFVYDAWNRLRKVTRRGDVELTYGRAAPNITVKMRHANMLIIAAWTFLGGPALCASGVSAACCADPGRAPVAAVDPCNDSCDEDRTCPPGDQRQQEAGCVLVCCSPVRTPESGVSLPDPGSFPIACLGSDGLGERLSPVSAGLDLTPEGYRRPPDALLNAPLLI